MPDTKQSTFVYLKVGTVEVPQSDYIQRVAHEFGADRSNQATFTLFDPDWTFLENLMVEGGVGTKVTFRYGWFGDASRTHEGVVHTFSIQFQSTGLMMLLVVRDTGQDCGINRVRQKTYDAEGYPTYDKIVREIASDNGWKTSNGKKDGDRIAATGPVQHGSEHSTINPGMSDLEFIMKKIVPYAKTTDGDQTFVAYFDEDQVFNFHPLDQKAPAKNSTRYVVMRGYDGLVRSFMPQDAGTLYQIVGGGNVVGRGLNQDDKEEFVAGHTAKNDGGNLKETTDTKRTGLKRNGEKIAKVGCDHKDGTRPTHQILNMQAQENKDYSETTIGNIHDRLAKMSFQATAAIHGNASIRVLDYVAFDIIRTDGSRHPWSGDYQVVGYSHRLSESDFETDLSLVRYGTGAGQDRTASTEANPKARRGEDLGGGTTTVTAAPLV